MYVVSCSGMLVVYNVVCSIVCIAADIYAVSSNVCMEFNLWSMVELFVCVFDNQNMKMKRKISMYILNLLNGKIICEEM
jgi:hypothetical protein